MHILSTGPLAVFVCAFCVSAFAGLAALLRAGKQVNALAIFSAMLNSGLLGLTLALLWYKKYQDNVYFLIGMCILAGLGGATMVDFVVNLFQSGGLKMILSDLEHVSKKGIGDGSK